MKVSLYLNNKILDFELPYEIDGNYLFDMDKNEENKLINIEAKDNKWFLCQSKNVQVFFNDTQFAQVELIPNNFYILKRNNISYLIYVSLITPGTMLSYTYKTDINVIMGGGESANLVFPCKYLNDLIVQISYQNNFLVLEKKGSVPVYINKYVLEGNVCYLKFGDTVELYGFRMMVLNGIILIYNNVTIKNEAHLTPYLFPKPEEIKQRDFKDVDLYDKKDYYSKSPRLRRIIETKNIKLSAPPRDGNSNEMPLILTVGPMFTMGIVSLVMLVNTIIQINNKKTTIEDSWPQLATSGAMLAAMLLWPIIIQLYNKHMKKKRKKEIIEKYSRYLEEKKLDLMREANLQKHILIENLLTVEECLKIIDNRRINFWDKRIDQSDFLVTRIGIGNEKLDVDIQYPEEDFTIDEDELRKMADQLVEDFKYIENVPIGYSFYENKITAVMGFTNNTIKFIYNVILQIITFYSYEDVKLVIFTSEERKKYWDSFRYLNHVFNNDRNFRFYSTTSESAKSITEYLQTELNSRISKLSDKKTIFKPYYFIIVDGYDEIKRFEFVKNVTEIDANLGFSLVILENQLSKLPSKCNNFINVSNNNTEVLKNAYEEQEQVNVTNDIDSPFDINKIVRILANIPIEFENDMRNLPDSLSFLEMEKIGKVEQLNILNRWNTSTPTESLKTEIGVDENGDLMYLDLHETYHGPHGLIAGMTGSGKSEFIITYILSLCINYSPDDVSFILIDYKGGGLAFAFENQANNIVLPHLAGTITNLDKAEMDRTLVSIDSEVKRRQKIFNDARDKLGESTMNIYKYQGFYKDGRLTEAIPHLFIICDEFAELKAQQPEFMDNLISVARIGRSLGVHLILATQKPSGVVNDQIWSNAKFRVCLKVQDEQDSKEMLKRPEAAFIKQTGRFYLQVGFDEYFALGQSAWCGAKYYPSDTIIKQVDKSINFINDCGVIVKSLQAASNVKLEAKGEQLASIMNSIINVSNHVGKKARKLWLDNIPPIITIGNLESKYNYAPTKFQVKAVIGEYDAPEIQEQGLICYDYLNDGNTIIYGNDGREREMLLSTMIYSTVKDYLASEVNFYFIDYGSESLRKYQSLAHVGGIVLAGEDEKYNNLFKMIKEELQQRKKLFANFGGTYESYIKNKELIPLKVIILNNYDSIYESNPSLYEEFPDIIRDSEHYGIIFILSANTINSVHSKISQNCPNVYTFKLKDPSDYISAFGMRSRVTLRDILGRGLLKQDTVHEFQTASIMDDEEKLNDYLANFITQVNQNNQFKAPLIPILPEVVSLESVGKYISSIENLPIGISKKDLEVNTVDLLSNLGFIITANRLNITNVFVRSFIEEISKIPNISIMIFDPLKLLKMDSNYQNYYTENIEKCFDGVISYIDQLITNKSNQQGVIIINGLNKFINNLSDKNKMTNLIKKLKEYEKISMLVVDDVSKIKQFSFEAWFNGFFIVNNGIWIGRGIADQNLLRVSNINKQMLVDITNDMGYLITDGSASLCKLINFTRKEGPNGE